MNTQNVLVEQNWGNSPNIPLAKETKYSYPSHWKFTRLEDISEIIMGQSPPSEAYNKDGQGLPFLQGKTDFTNYLYPIPTTYCTKPIKIAKRGSILICVRAPVGDINIADQDYIIGRGLASIILKQNDNLFLFYLLLHSKDKIRTQGSGTTFESINRDVLANIPIILPPLPEQRAIAHVLQTVQQAIQTRRKELELERERKAALMQHLFTRGTRNEPTKQSEVGEIPESWEVEQLKGAIRGESQNGAFIKSPQWGSGILYANVYDIYQNVVLDLSNLQRVECPNELIKRYTLKENDLLFVRSSLKRDGVGQCCLVKNLLEPSIFDCHLIRLTPDTLILDPLYLTYYFLSERGRDNLVARSKTTTMTTLNQNTLLETAFPLPSSKDEQQNIAATLQACDAKIAALEKEIALHEELFRALLDELMTGRISTLPVVEQLEKGTLTYGQRAPDGTGTTH